MTVEDALWRCYELSGADTSDGRFPGWELEAVLSVEALREDSDRIADACCEIHAILGKVL